MKLAEAERVKGGRERERRRKTGEEQQTKVKRVKCFGGGVMR